MTDTKRRLLGMGIPLGLVFCADTALAVEGGRVIPDSLILHALARIHPQVVLCGYLAWAATIVGLLLLTPEVLAVILTIAVAFGHVAGTYSQLTSVLGHWWYQAANGMFLITALALGTGLWWSARPSLRVNRATRATCLPPWLRWGLIASLSGVAGGMVLIPQCF
jgi:hypothetical protein